jgi:type IV secretion system protein VirB10
MVDVPPPPPPPENPFDIGSDPFTMPENNGGSLGQATPNVAARPGRALVVLGIVITIILFLLYNVFYNKKKVDITKPKEISIAPAAPEPPPPLPAAQPPVAAPPSILPPTIPEPTKVQILKPEDDSAAKAQAQARLHSKMMLADGSNDGLGSEKAKEPGDPTDPNSIFAANASAEKVKRVKAGRIGSLNRVIAQGRIIQATMESALNTDLPAPIRAIVSRDTFGEAGTIPLIPKGSRLIGTYNTDLSSGQSRVFVVWTRVIRPDGVDVMLGSPLVDSIGQAGIGGQVDSKFQQIFSRSVLSSVVGIAFAIGSDKISGGSTTTSNNASGSSTTGDAATTATVNALNRLGSVTDSFVQKFLDVKPTILVDQGTPVNVFVNRDILFPSDTAGTRVIN